MGQQISKTSAGPAVGVERERELAAVSAWARAALTDPQVCVLDTETTGVGQDARIVEISVLGVDGQVLLDTLVNPGVPIPAEASAVHGITDAMVADAPPFSEVLVPLTTALFDRRVLVYNDRFDVGRLRLELELHYRRTHEDAAACADSWIAAMTWDDVMGPYATWCGVWSPERGRYSHQPLGGAHRALGDCRAVLSLLERLSGPAAAPVPGQSLLTAPETI
jgi:DNA polymerase III epsilon subunit-like protein